MASSEKAAAMTVINPFERFERIERAYNAEHELARAREILALLVDEVPR